MPKSSGGSARRRAGLGVLGATLIVALCLAATGVARTTTMHRSFTARIARAQQVARGLRGAAARQAFHNQAVQAAGSSPTPTHTPDDGDLADQQAAYNNERLAPGTTVSGEALLAGPAAGQCARPLRWSLAGGHQPALQRQPARLHGPLLVQRRLRFLDRRRPHHRTDGRAERHLVCRHRRRRRLELARQGRHLVTAHRRTAQPLDRRARRRPRRRLGLGRHRRGQHQPGQLRRDRRVPARRLGRHRPGRRRRRQQPAVGPHVYQISFDPQGNAYAATNNGLFRYATELGPVDRGARARRAQPARVVDLLPYNDHITSVAVVPGSQGQDVIAVEGWRGPGQRPEERLL